MKRVTGYLAAVLVGTMMSGGVALATAHYVKATIGPSQIQVNGHVVAKAPKLVYGGNVYVQVKAVQKALTHALGKTPTWANGHLNIIVPTTPTGSASPPSGSSVNVAQLPYTVQYADGMKLTVNSVTATPTSTVLNVTMADVGTQTNAITDQSTTTLADGGPQVPFVTEDDVFYNGIQPGQSITGNITFGPLLSGATQFTWYLTDFGLNTHALPFNLTS